MAMSSARHPKKQEIYPLFSGLKKYRGLRSLFKVPVTRSREQAPGFQPGTLWHQSWEMPQAGWNRKARRKRGDGTRKGDGDLLSTPNLLNEKGTQATGPTLLFGRPWTEPLPGKPQQPPPPPINMLSGLRWSPAACPRDLRGQSQGAVSFSTVRCHTGTLDGQAREATVAAVPALEAGRDSRSSLHRPAVSSKEEHVTCLRAGDPISTPGITSPSVRPCPAG